MTERIQDRDRVLEGRWEEVAAHGGVFTGRRVRLTILADDANEDQPASALLTFDEIFAPLRRDVEQSGINDDELDALLQEARGVARSWEL